MHLKLHLGMRNKKVWKKLEFFPFARLCLEDTKVKHKFVIWADDGTIHETADLNTFVVMLALEEETTRLLLSHSIYLDWMVACVK